MLLWLFMLTILNIFIKKSTHFQVKSTVTEVLKVNTATVIIVNVSMDMDLLATDIVTDTIELNVIQNG